MKALPPPCRLTTSMVALRSTRTSSGVNSWGKTRNSKVSQSAFCSEVINLMSPCAVSLGSDDALESPVLTDRALAGLILAQRRERVKGLSFWAVGI